MLRRVVLQVATHTGRTLRAGTTHLTLRSFSTQPVPQALQALHEAAADVDHAALTAAIQGLRGSPAEALKVFNAALDGEYGPGAVVQTETLNALLEVLGTSPSHHGDLLSVYNRALGRDLGPDVVADSWTVRNVIRGLGRSDSGIDAAMEVFKACRAGESAPLSPAIVTALLTVLAASSRPFHNMRVPKLFGAVCSGELPVRATAGMLAATLKVCAKQQTVWKATEWFERAKAGDYGDGLINSVTANTMLSVLASARPAHGPHAPYDQQALELFQDMAAGNLGPAVSVDKWSVSSVIKALGSAQPPRADEALAIFEGVQRGAYGDTVVDTFIATALLDVLGRAAPPRTDSALAVFHATRKGNYGPAAQVTTVMANALLHALAQSEPPRLQDVQDVYAGMAAGRYGEQAKPNAVSVATLMDAVMLARPPKVDVAMRAFEALVRGDVGGAAVDRVVLNAAIRALGGAWPPRTDAAVKLFGDWRKGVYAPSIAVPDVGAFMTVLADARPPRVKLLQGSLNDVESGAFGSRVMPNAHMASSLIHALWREGAHRVPDAVKVFHDVANGALGHRAMPDTVLVCGVLTALNHAQPPRVDEALAIFEATCGGEYGRHAQVDADMVSTIMATLGLVASPRRTDDAMAVFQRLREGEFGGQAVVSTRCVSVAVKVLVAAEPSRVDDALAMFDALRRGDFGPDVRPNMQTVLDVIRVAGRNRRELSLLDVLPWATAQPFFQSSPELLSVVVWAFSYLGRSSQAASWFLRIVRMEGPAAFVNPSARMQLMRAVGPRRAAGLLRAAKAAGATVK